MRRSLYRTLFRWLGVDPLFRQVVVEDRLQDVRAGIRRDLQTLLETVDQNNSFFRGKFTSFLSEHAQSTDEVFFAGYAQLPAFSKQDYAEAGSAVMAPPWDRSDPEEMELHVRGRPLESLRRLRRGDFLMPMATGGSSALPLVVRMTKHHMFSMLFTFFKCWYRMGWRPGDRLMIFYPQNTYNIDEMVTFNRLSWLTGFRYHLFSKIDEEVVRGLVDDLNRYKPRLLLVFPSPMNMIAHTIRRCKLPLRHQPALINVSGETFFDCQKRNIQAVFPRSRVEDSYGSVELGEIAHQADGGLEVFANVAYVETEPNAQGQPEMVVTRLHLGDFPFIRYKMRDVAQVAWHTDAQGHERCLITQIEGKDTNFILNDVGERFYPSFFNQFVNRLNAQFHDAILEIKVYERAQRELEVQMILRDPATAETIGPATHQMLRQEVSPRMDYRVRFVDYIDHDYRRKYRVIERLGDVEFAGGIVGDTRKSQTVADVESVAFQESRQPREPVHAAPQFSESESAS